ncbi:uncharacterized protein DUF4760 [Paracandidimonas soli]|uniref:Uncharacterized protein DUF4760 n=1 Tax=Paracandidimonas soli TaxID=1917182 RepID=A0A4R3V106_9BURK|nr:uncharacterized protein DUF4760 [Paracandidimonas soli]
MTAIGAIAVIYYNGKQARLRALIDLVVHQKTHQELVDATRRVNALHKKGGSWTKHLDPDCQERKDILMILNNQEFIAVGVRLGSFDENTYKQMQYTNVMRLWEASKGFIEEIRREHKKDTLFQDFEKLALRWKKKPIRQIV